MVDPATPVGQPPPLGIPPKGIPPTDPKYRDLAARGKLPRNVFNVLSYGASGDGNIDDTKAIQRAVDAASKAGAGTVYIPKGTYRCTDKLDLYSNIAIRGEGRGTVLKWEGDNTPPNFLSAVGTAVADIYLTASASEGATALTVTAGDEAGFAAGDHVLIHSTEVFENDGSVKCGEIQQVVSTASGQINLHDGLFDGYTTGATAKVRKLNLIENVVLQDFVVEGLLNNGKDEQGAVDFTNCKGVTVRNVRFNNIGRWHLIFTRSIDVSVIGCEFNHTSPDLQGYGVDFVACQYGVVIGCHFNECRHAVTGGGSSVVGGVSRMITIVGNTCRDSKSVSIHSHGAGEYWIVADNAILGGDEYGISTRGPNWSIQGNTIHGAAGGILCQNYSEDRRSGYIIIGNRVNVLGCGILVSPISGASTNNDGVQIEGNFVETTTIALANPGISVGDLALSAMRGVTVTGNSVRIFGTGENNPYGIYLKNCSGAACVGNSVYHSGANQTRPLYRFDDVAYFAVNGNVGVVGSADGTDHMDLNNCDNGAVNGNSLVNGTNGINLDANCSNIAVVGNSLYSMSSAAIVDSGSGDKRAHNIGDATHNL